MRAGKQQKTSRPVEEGSTKLQNKMFESYFMTWEKERKISIRNKEGTEQAVPQAKYLFLFPMLN